ncbi:MAG: methylated-DNA--[protein]-cysteine S-methyltransferase [Anaerolineae bacterium]
MADSNIMFTETPLGLMWIWATSKGLCGSGFGDSVGDATISRFARYGIGTPQPSRTPLLSRARDQLLDYFAWKRDAFDIPLDLRGTEFQRAVWERLLGLRYGERTTYGDVAMMLGKPKASRAVGQAVGANPVAVIVPCHRVVGSDGSLTGYGGGLERKAALLELEQTGLQLRLQLRFPFTQSH